MDTASSCDTCLAPVSKGTQTEDGIVQSEAGHMDEPVEEDVGRNMEFVSSFTCIFLTFFKLLFNPPFSNSSNSDSDYIFRNYRSNDSDSPLSNAAAAARGRARIESESTQSGSDGEQCHFHFSHSPLIPFRGRFIK